MSMHFVVCPKVLRIMLKGLGVDEVGVTFNYDSPVTIKNAICVTKFCRVDSTDVVWHEYRLAAGISHHGDSPTAGHFPAFLSCVMTTLLLMLLITHLIAL